MLRPYSSRTAGHKAFTEPKGSSLRKGLLIVGLPLMAILALVSPTDIYNTFANGGLRQLAVNCVHNIYALNAQMALDLPRPPTVSAGLEIPSYISICKEWVQRGTGVEEALYTVEDDTVCMDWSSPHERLLEIISSSILDRVNGKSRYRHDCFKSRQWDEAVTGMDRTTIQQMIPVARMDPNLLYVSVDEIRAQCKVCLANFEPYVEKNQFKAYASHQCLSFPQEWEGATWPSALKVSPGLAGDAVVLPEDPISPNVVPLSTVYKQVRSRLGYVAKIFSNVTDSPPMEHDSGVVIYIDPTSKSVAKEVYVVYFPELVTSITVLSSPLCATAVLATAEKCLTYANDLVAYFKSIYPGLKTSGYEGSAGIQFQMVASTAGAFSRMILTKKLICPPATPTCLFPGMSKYQDEEAGFNTTAVIMDCRQPIIGSSDCGKATAFFVNVGHGQRVTVELVGVVNNIIKPPSVDAPLSSDNNKAAEHFQWVMEDNWSDEGYLKSQQPTTKMSRSQASARLDANILEGIEQWNLPSTELNPNAYIPSLEVSLSMEHILSAKVAEVPINVNYGIRETTKRVMEELGLDVDLGFAKRALTESDPSAQKKLRDASHSRITQFVKRAKAKQYEDASRGDLTPGMEMEIYCPEVTDDGYKIEYDGGSTRVAKDDTVVISDGAGTVTFDKATLTESTIDMPRSAEDSQRPFTFIYDPVTKQNITISGKNVTINRYDGIINSKPVGILLINNQTDENTTATLITEGSSGSLTGGDKQKIYSGTIISTDMNRIDTGNVIRTGDGYSINTDPNPGQQRTEDYLWNTFNSRESPYFTSEVGVRGLDRDIVKGKQPKELKLGEQYKYEAPSPEPPVIGFVDEHVSNQIPLTFNRRLLGQEKAELLAAMTRALHQKDMNRGVAITVPTQDFNFGNPDELARVCHHHKEKVVRAVNERKLFLNELTSFESLDGLERNIHTVVDMN